MRSVPMSVRLNPKWIKSGIWDCSGGDWTWTERTNTKAVFLFLSPLRYMLHKDMRPFLVLNTFFFFFKTVSHSQPGIPPGIKYLVKNLKSFLSENSWIFSQLPSQSFQHRNQNKVTLIENCNCIYHCLAFKKVKNWGLSSECTPTRHEADFYLQDQEKKV